MNDDDDYIPFEGPFRSGGPTIRKMTELEIEWIKRWKEKRRIKKEGGNPMNAEDRGTP